jgi:hypothetical protein
VTIPFPPAAERHEASRRLYLARDLEGYMAFFAPDLIYRRAGGESLTLAQLTRDVADQFRRFNSANWTSRSESEERDGDRIIEIVSQSGTFGVTAFGILRREWKLERRARYTWKVYEGRWRIAEVQVLEETLTGSGLKFGRSG